MITALILAAGQSKRMGQPKMLLPWGKMTVLEKVISTFTAAGIEEILVITGGDRERVEAIIGESARSIFNPNYSRGEMLSSVKKGLAGVNPDADAVLIGLGDQPQIQESSVRAVVDHYQTTRAPLVVPSYRMRRGHPWLVTRPHWDEILHLGSHASLRDFLNSHAREISYIELETSSILQDLDTTEEYLKSKP